MEMEGGECADLGTDGGDGVDGGGHPETVSVTQLLPLPSVKGDPGSVPGNTHSMQTDRHVASLVNISSIFPKGPKSYLSY